MSTNPTTYESLRRLIYGARPVQLIAAAAEFGIADLLADGPRSSAELAELTGANDDALHRVLRALAQLGVFTMLDDDRFALAPMGEHLRTGILRSLRATARAMGADFMVLPGFRLPHTIRTGETASDYVFGMTRFEYMAANPQAAAIFNDFMTDRTDGVRDAVVAAHDWNSFERIVDVGGGNGTLIAAMLQAHPAPRGTVFDLPHCQERALEYLATAGVASRSEFVGGSFFETVPTGADAYCLKSIIHDHDDEHSAGIFRTCRRAMSPTSKLFLIEQLLPSGNEFAPEVVSSDITMLMNTGGRERTADEYGGLMAAADLQLTNVIPTDSTYYLLEAVPVSGTGYGEA